MPHPIYGAPDHRLTAVRFTLRVPTATNQRHASIEVVGSAPTSRASLWSIREDWAPEDMAPGGYQPADAIHHLALISMQDKPASQGHVEMCLRGQGWEQLELPL